MAYSGTIPNVTYKPSAWADEYVGRAEDLIAAGLISADQLPGGPGHNKVMRSFFDGRPLRQGANHVRDERWLQIKRLGLRFRVSIGVPAKVQELRRAGVAAAHHAHIENQAPCQEGRRHLRLVWSAP